MWFVEECRKHLGDFENGAILLSGHIFAEPGKSNWVEHALHSVHYIFETLQYDAYTFLLHPLRVVAFLRERPGVAFDRSEEHTSELQSHLNLVCRLLLEKKKTSPSFSILHQSSL